MTIVHVVEPFASGTTTFIIRLSRTLPDQHHVVVHGSRTWVDSVEKVKDRFPANVEFILWKNAVREINPVMDLLSLIELIRILRRLQCDVIHLHSAKAGALGRMAGWLLGKKNIIYTPHGAPFLRQDISFVSRNLFLFSEKIVGRLTGQVVCCSRSEMEAYQAKGINASFINNGTSIFEVNKKPSTTLRIGCFAILTRQKNPALFNQIATHFKDDPQLEFFWVGDGKLRHLLDAPNIQVTGWLDEAETNDMQGKMDIYLSCSMWEGLPFSVLEAMNAGSCLLLSNCPGNSDLIKSGVNGYLYNSEDEAVTCLNDLKQEPQKVKRMGEESKLMAGREFDILTMGKNYLEKYRELTLTQKTQ